MILLFLLWVVLWMYDVMMIRMRSSINDQWIAEWCVRVCMHGFTDSWWRAQQPNRRAVNARPSCWYMRCCRPMVPKCTTADHTSKPMERCTAGDPTGHPELEPAMQRRRPKGKRKRTKIGRSWYYLFENSKLLALIRNDSECISANIFRF